MSRRYVETVVNGEVGDQKPNWGDVVVVTVTVWRRACGLW